MGSSFKHLHTPVRLHLREYSPPSSPSSSDDSDAMVADFTYDGGLTTAKSRGFSIGNRLTDTHVTYTETTLTRRIGLEQGFKQVYTMDVENTSQLLLQNEGLKYLLKIAIKDNRKRSNRIKDLKEKNDELHDYCEYIFKERNSYHRIYLQTNASLQRQRKLMQTLRSKHSKTTIQNWTLKSVIRKLLNDARRDNYVYRDTRKHVGLLQQEKNDKKMEMSKCTEMEILQRKLEQDKNEEMQKMTQLQKQYAVLEKSNERATSENTNLQKRIKALEVSLASERQRISDILRDKQKLETNQYESPRMSDKFMDLIKENSRLQDLTQRLEREKEQVTYEINTLKHTMRKEGDLIASRRHALSHEQNISRLVEETAKYKDEIKCLKMNNDHQQKLHLEIEEQNETLKQENGSMFHQLAILEKEIEELKRDKANEASFLLAQQKSTEKHDSEVMRLRDENIKLKEQMNVGEQREKSAKDVYEKSKSDLERSISRLHEDKAELKRQIQQLKEVAEQCKLNQRTADALTNKVQMNKGHEELESERQRKALEKVVQQLKQDNKNLCSENVLQKENIELLKKRIEKDFDLQQQEETSKTRSNLENMALRQDISRLEKEIKSLRSSEVGLRETNTKLLTQIKQVEHDRDKKEANVNAMKTTLDSMMEEKRIKEEEVDRIRHQHTNAISEVTQLKSQYKTMQTAYHDLRRNLQDQSRKRSDLETSLDQLKKEKSDLLNRLSQIASSKLTEGNPGIVDLSDEKRPTKLAEIYSELYDNEWTEAFDEQVNFFHKEEKSAIQTLFQILLVVHSVCQEYSDGYLNNLRIAASGVPGKQDSLLFQVSSGGDAPVELNKTLRQIRDMSAPSILRNIRQDLETTWNQTGVQIQEMTRIYIEKCLELCWEMSVKDPPVVLMTTPAVGSPVDKDRFRFYTQSGTVVDFVVWPTLLLHQNGPTLAKGVLQGRQS